MSWDSHGENSTMHLGMPLSFTEVEELLGLALFSVPGGLCRKMRT